MSNNKLAIVILNWNTQSLLEKFLPKVIENSDDSRAFIVVADNNSTDNSVNWIKQNHPTIKIIEFDKNYGFAEGYNRALSQLDCEYVTLLNSDAVPEKGWIEPLLNHLDNNPKTAAVVPKIKDYNNPEYFEYAGAAGGFIDRWGFPFCRGRIFDSIEKDEKQYDDEIPVFWGSGAALTVRRELFLESGGLDPDFFAHMEEIDWCWRIQNFGYAIIYIPQSTVYHVGGGTLDYLNERKTFLNFRNNLFLLLKNVNGVKVYPLLFARRIIDFVALLNFLRIKQSKNSLAIHKAHVDFFKKFSLFNRKRKELKKKRVVSKNRLIYKGSIVWDYNIKGRKNFSDLGI